MSTPSRLRRPAKPATPPPVSAPQPTPAPKRVIPIQAAKAFVPPEPLEGNTGPKVDYNDVIRRYKDKVTNRATAIRAKCVECSCGVLSEVKNCTVKSCALYPFRTGEDPFRKKRVGFAGKASADDEGDDE